MVVFKIYMIMTTHYVFKYFTFVYTLLSPSIYCIFVNLYDHHNML